MIVSKWPTGWARTPLLQLRDCVLCRWSSCSTLYWGYQYYYSRAALLCLVQIRSWEEEYNKMTSYSTLALSRPRHGIWYSPCPRAWRNIQHAHRVCAVTLSWKRLRVKHCAMMLHEGWKKRKRRSRAGGRGREFVKEVEEGRKDGVRCR